MKKTVILPNQTALEEKKGIKLCGVRQNCFRLDYSGKAVSTISPNVTQDKYVSLERKSFANGFAEGLVKKDYPINAKSVSSLAEGADYRNDPAQAIAQAPKRVNLGDVTEAQAFLDNPQYSASLFNDIKSKLNAYYSSITKDNTTNKEGDTNGN